jgi:hypothetical protein
MTFYLSRLSYEVTDKDNIVFPDRYDTAAGSGRLLFISPIQQRDQSQGRQGVDS